LIFLSFFPLEQFWQRLRMAPTDLSTIVLLENDRAYTKSTAVLKIARRLVWPWRIAAFALVIPAAWRDQVYQSVARNRYGWFGQQTSCPVPTDGMAERFL
jgi:predicted DCC family thiol-disulfide oxidoreductase YuxK